MNGDLRTHGQRLLDLLGNGPSAVFDLVARHGIECEAVHTGTLPRVARRFGRSLLELGGK